MLNRRLHLINISADKRPYLADYQPLISVLYPKKLGLQVTKAGVLAFSQALLKYNVWLDASVKAQEKDEEIADFDFDALWSQSIVSFIDSGQRGLLVSFILKYFEFLVYTYASTRVADRLVKDIGKSLVRKLKKFSRYEACKRIFRTSVWSNTLLYCTNCVYDTALDVISYTRYCLGYDGETSGKKGTMTIAAGSPQLGTSSTISGLNPLGQVAPIEIKSISQLIIRMAKRGVLYTVGLVSTAGGFAVGAYIQPDVGGPVVSALFDLIAYSITSAILGM